MSRPGQSSLNRRLKSWPGWVVMTFAIVALLVVGSTRSSGPQTQEDRVDDITRRLACPICDGESVFESQNNASRSIRNEVTDLVREAELADDQILAVFETRNAEILLVPKASGFDALIWVLPVMGFVIGVAALAVTFRRWRLEAAGMAGPTDADRELVRAALLNSDLDGDRTEFAPEDGWPDPDHLSPGRPDPSGRGPDHLEPDYPESLGPGPDHLDPGRREPLRRAHLPDIGPGPDNNASNGAEGNDR